MKQFIEGVFTLLAVLFDKVPLLNKLSGYRTVLGFLGLAVVSVLKMKGIGSDELLTSLQIGFTALSALALNSKGRE
ncbi:MAG: hypothetical protein SFW66_08925 [Gammaproteobacteria bacterium]|nr:hypothetical protein [Gammaproteobacteria bacterium]